MRHEYKPVFKSVALFARFAMLMIFLSGVYFNGTCETLLSKLGFVCEGTMRQYGYWKNQYHDLKLFALLKVMLKGDAIHITRHPRKKMAICDLVIRAYHLSSNHY